MPNVVILSGRLGADPEVNFTSGGKAVAKFRLAHGKKGETPEWFTVVAWERLAETTAKALTKGSYVTITGKLKNREWEDKKSGQKKSVTEIVADSIATDAPVQKVDKPQPEQDDEVEIPF